MFVVGLFLLALGLVGLFFSIFPPIEEARWGAIGVAFGCGLSGALLAYLSAPSGGGETPEGMVRGRATILGGEVTEGSVAGYQMVELMLEVRPKGGSPLHVKRKFSAGRLGLVEAGREIDVVYDPANPERLELA